MKKTVIYILQPVFATMLVACTPTISTEILQRYTPLPLDSVKVYDDPSLVPSSATAIGKVNITGLDMPGADTKEAMKRVGLKMSDIKKDANPKVMMAKVMAANAGGNGLLMSNGSEVGYLKSYYFGTILRSEDNVVNNNVTSPAVKAHEYNKEKLSELVKKHSLPSNVLKVNVGPAWLTSKMYVTSSNYYSNLSALNVELQYSHLWKSGWGCGFTAFQSHFDIGDSDSYDRRGSANIFYVGPTLTYAYRTDKGWLWTMNYGLGYTSFDADDVYSGFGMTFNVGVDYMLTKHLGVGIELNEYAGFFKEPEGWQNEHDESYGISQFGLLAGLRWYF